VATQKPTVKKAHDKKEKRAIILLRGTLEDRLKQLCGTTEDNANRRLTLAADLTTAILEAIEELQAALLTVKAACELNTRLPE
jgi:hypothetical protein